MSASAVNPLQDLVDDVANAGAPMSTATRPSTSAALRYASAAADEEPLTLAGGVRHASPGLARLELPHLLAPSVGLASAHSGAPAPSPTGSVRSIQSEALSQLSTNPGAINMRVRCRAA